MSRYLCRLLNEQDVAVYVKLFRRCKWNAHTEGDDSIPLYNYFDCFKYVMPITGITLKTCNQNRAFINTTGNMPMKELLWLAGYNFILTSFILKSSCDLFVFNIYYLCHLVIFVILTNLRIMNTQFYYKFMTIMLVNTTVHSTLRLGHMVPKVLNSPSKHLKWSAKHIDVSSIWHEVSSI